MKNLHSRDGLRGLALALGLALMLAPSFAPTLAQAAGDSDDGAEENSSAAATQYRTAKRAIEQKRYAVAIPILEKVIAAEPRNAGAYNYLAYAHRNLGRLDVAYTLYQKALELDPRHRGAHEYLGELYLQRGDLARAEEMLKKLDGLCLFGCEEYTDLKKAIARYKAAKGGKS
ncbi:MAG: tetratricopeptide repeat protein [Alphaproteobacteria bacterium]|nr:tetratricopeptide repeat protein [Alphaproteobacteria bacterium]